MRCLFLFLAPFFPIVLAAQRQHCESTRQPDPLPIAMQLVDSTALAASLPKGVLSPTTFSLWYDSTGQLTHVLALTDSLVVRGAAPADSATVARAGLGALIAGATFPQDSGRETIVRLTVARDGSGSLSLSVARSIVCTPVALPHFRPPNERINTDADEIDDLLHANPAAVTFVVDSSGHVLELLITRSSGSRLVDSRVVESITSARYQPAMVDGFAKKASVSLNIMPPRVTREQRP